MTVTWLHVSDFHIKTGDSYDRDVVLGALVKAVSSFRAEGRAPQLIFATGDIAYSGKAEEYLLADAFFDALLDATGLDKRRLFLVPGNHDVDRDRGSGLDRTFKTEEEITAYFRPGFTKPHITERQAAFGEWYDRYFDGARVFPRDSTCGPVATLDVDGTVVDILPINTALFAQGDDDFGKLLVGPRCLDTALNGLSGSAANLRVALMHHPPGWLSDVERSIISSSLNRGVDVVASGHQHENDAEAVMASLGDSIRIAAGASYQTSLFPNRALYGTFDGPTISVFPIAYQHRPHRVWTLDPGLFPDQPNYEKSYPVSRSAATASPPLASHRTGRSRPPANGFLTNIGTLHGAQVVGRDKLLDSIHKALRADSSGGVLVLRGQPGVGKSEVAREYARRYCADYPDGTFFIDGRAGNVSIELVRLGAAWFGFDFPADLPSQDRATRTLVELWSRRALVILDDVTDKNALEPLLPRAGMPCQVVVTTLLDQWGPDWTKELVTPLPADDALALIESLGGREIAEARGAEIVALAGGLPIQLCSLARTLSEALEHGEMADVPVSLAPEAGQRFHEIVFERLDPNAQLLLLAAALLDGQHLHRSELLLHLRAAGLTDATISSSFGACLRIGLLEGGDELRLHQLYGAYLMTSEAAKPPALSPVRDAQRRRFIELGAAIVEDPADHDRPALLLEYPADPASWERAGAPVSVGDGETVGRALLDTGRFEAARPWFARAVESMRPDSSRNGQEYGSNLHRLGDTFSGMGRLDEARSCYEQAADAKRLGNGQGVIDHDSLGDSLLQVGYCYSHAGHWTEARPWFKDAAAESGLGDIEGRIDHASMGTDYHEIGWCYAEVGEFEAARPWYEAAAAQKRRGDMRSRVDHGSVGMSLHETGWCYAATRRFEEARPLYEQAVAEALQGDIYGRIDHARLGWSLRGVGFTYSQTGQLATARPYYEKAVTEAGLGDVYGRLDHESIARGLLGIAFTYSQSGMFQEALPLLEKAAQESRLGDLHSEVDHASLARTIHLIATCHLGCGDLGGAEQQFREAIEEARHGDGYGRVDHSSLRLSLNGLADVLLAQKRETEAERLKKEAQNLPESPYASVVQPVVDHAVGGPEDAMGEGRPHTEDSLRADRNAG